MDPPNTGSSSVRDRRLAERADPDRGHRDPDLAGGDVVADVVHLGQRQRAPREPSSAISSSLALRERTSAYSAITKNALTRTSSPVRMMKSAVTDRRAAAGSDGRDGALRQRAATSG